MAAAEQGPAKKPRGPDAGWEYEDDCSIYHNYLDPHTTDGNRAFLEADLRRNKSQVGSLPTRACLAHTIAAEMQSTHRMRKTTGALTLASQV